MFVIFVFRQWTLNGKLLQVKLALIIELLWWKKLNFKTFLASLNLNFPGERKNTETEGFHGNGPWYCKTPPKTI